MCVLIGPLVWFLVSHGCIQENLHFYSSVQVYEEVKRARKSQEEELNAELHNPYAQPPNPFYNPTGFPSALDPDIVQSPPHNPYTSGVPPFDPDSAWAPPPNPYRR